MEGRLPGLLQTDAYARAVITLGHDDAGAAAIGRLFIEAAPLNETPAILRRILDEIGDRGFCHEDDADFGE
jgi:hypothetical protein